MNQGAGPDIHRQRAAQHPFQQPGSPCAPAVQLLGCSKMSASCCTGILNLLVVCWDALQKMALKLVGGIHHVCISVSCRNSS